MTSKRKNSYTYAVPMLLILCTVWLLVRSETAEEAALRALKMCTTVIVPSLFPYMVISSMLVRTGAAGQMGKWLARPTRGIFRLPGCSGGALLLGALCGFPVGAKTACELYENNTIKKRECERLIAIANNTGPSFVIEVVGAHFWGSRGMGLVIYTAQILSAVLLGWFTSRTEMAPDESNQLTAAHCDIMQCFASSVSHSARSVVSVCGFIVFFAVITALSDQLLGDLRMSAITPILGAFLEFSTGASAAADLGGVPGAFLTGFAVGWSGVSVFAQCSAFTSQHGISLRLAVICKTVQGCMTGLAAAVYYAFWFNPSATASTVIPQTDISAVFVAAEFLILALASMEIPRRNT